MLFTKKSVFYLLLILSSAQTSLGAHNEDIRVTAAKLSNKHPFVAAFATSALVFGITGFLRKSPIKFLTAFSLTNIIGAFASEAISKAYLNKNGKNYDTYNGKNPCFMYEKHTNPQIHTVVKEDLGKVQEASNDIEKSIT